MGEDDASVAVDAAGVGGHSDVVGIPEAHAHRHLGALFRHDVFHAHLRRNGVTRVTALGVTMLFIGTKLLSVKLCGRYKKGSKTDVRKINKNIRAKSNGHRFEPA